MSAPLISMLVRRLTNVFVLIVERSMGKLKGVCGFVMLLVMFCIRCWDCLFVCGFCFGCLWWLS